MFGRVFLAMLASTLISLNGAEGGSGIADQEAEFDRTTLCVRGAMPMELIFDIADNPARARPEEVPEQYLRRVVLGIDGGLKNLLANAARESAEVVAVRHDSPWTPAFTQDLEIEIAIAIADAAPARFGIDVCGSHQLVGSTVLALIYEYFNRAAYFERHETLGWVEKLGGVEKMGRVLLILSALSLADIDHDWELIAGLLEEGSSVK